MSQPRRKERSPYRRTPSPGDWPLGLKSLKHGEPGWYFVPRTWLTLGGLLGASIGIAGLSLWHYARWVEPRWIDWHHVTLPIAGLPAAFGGYRIIHLTDLHLGIGKLPDMAFMRHIVRRVNRYRPDLIAITGDFISSVDPVSEAGIAELAHLRAPDGVWCVPGNHDSWGGIDHVMQSVRAAGVQPLINTHHTIRRGRSRIVLAGIDDPWDGHPDLNRAMADVPDDSPVILLAHAPNVADAAIRYPSIAVQLSGHSHGGQVRIPGIGPLVLPDQSWRYPSGLYQVARADSDRALWVYTNRGLGMSDLPFRFACRPEVGIITLKSAPNPI